MYSLRSVTTTRTSGTRAPWVLPWQNRFSGLSRPPMYHGSIQHRCPSHFHFTPWPSPLPHLTSTQHPDPQLTSTQIPDLPHFHSTPWTTSLPPSTLANFTSLKIMTYLTFTQHPVPPRFHSPTWPTSLFHSTWWVPPYWTYENTLSLMSLIGSVSQGTYFYTHSIHFFNTVELKILGYWINLTHFQVF